MRSRCLRGTSSKCPLAEHPETVVVIMSLSKWVVGVRLVECLDPAHAIEQR